MAYFNLCLLFYHFFIIASFNHLEVKVLGGVNCESTKLQLMEFGEIHSFSTYLTLKLKPLRKFDSLGLMT
jgi:hypothetical protein